MSFHSRRSRNQQIQGVVCCNMNGLDVPILTAACGSALERLDHRCASCRQLLGRGPMAATFCHIAPDLGIACRCDRRKAVAGGTERYPPEWNRADARETGIDPRSEVPRRDGPRGNRRHALLGGPARGSDAAVDPAALGALLDRCRAERSSPRPASPSQTPGPTRMKAIAEHCGAINLVRQATTPSGRGGGLGWALLLLTPLAHGGLPLTADATVAEKDSAARPAVIGGGSSGCSRAFWCQSMTVG